MKVHRYRYTKHEDDGETCTQRVLLCVALVMVVMYIFSDAILWLLF
jgi:hypothetical protein